MNILVTGGAGFIGSHIVDSLLTRGVQVTVLDDLSTGHLTNLTLHENLKFVEGSVTNRMLVGDCAQGVSHILHLAAVVSVQDSVNDPIRSHEVNLTGTINLLEAARRNGSRVVFASSAAVYGNNGQAVQREGEESLPISPYGVQKLASERYCEMYQVLYGVQSVCFRQFNVYGPRQDPTSPYSGVISIFAKRAMEGKDLFINGDGLQTRDFIYVKDVVQSYLAAVDATVLPGSALNIGTGKTTTIKELAESIVKITKGSASQIQHRDPMPGDIRDSCADPGLARKQGLLTSTCVELIDGLRETLAWYGTT